MVSEDSRASITIGNPTVPQGNPAFEEMCAANYIGNPIVKFQLFQTPKCSIFVRPPHGDGPISELRQNQTLRLKPRGVIGIAHVLCEKQTVGPKCASVSSVREVSQISTKCNKLLCFDTHLTGANHMHTRQKVGRSRCFGASSSTL